MHCTVDGLAHAIVSIFLTNSLSHRLGQLAYSKKYALVN